MGQPSLLWTLLRMVRDHWWQHWLLKHTAEGIPAKQAFRRNVTCAEVGVRIGAWTRPQDGQHLNHQQTWGKPACQGPAWTSAIEQERSTLLHWGPAGDKTKGYSRTRWLMDTLRLQEWMPLAVKESSIRTPIGSGTKNGFRRAGLGGEGKHYQAPATVHRRSFRNKLWLQWSPYVPRHLLNLNGLHFFTCETWGWSSLLYSNFQGVGWSWGPQRESH